MTSTRDIRTPSPQPVHHWKRWVAALLTTLALGAGVATALGWAPWLFASLVIVAGAYVVLPDLGWGRAFWMSVLVALSVATWVLVVDPFVRVRLDIAMIVTLCVVLVGALMLRWRANRGAAVVLPRAIETAALLLPALVSGAVYWIITLTRPFPVSWAMGGDAQFNTVLARQVSAADGQILHDGEVLSLAQGLMAAVHLPGRSSVSADDLLLHDVVRQSDLWILIVLLSSVLAGCLAELVLRNVARPLRLFGILAAGVLPLTWHMTGYAMNSGFYNVSIAFLALELAFYVWLVIPRSPLVRSTLLLVLAVVTLGAWTPLAIVPAALAAWSSWQGWRAAPGRRAAIIWGAAALQFVIFVVVFILPGFLAKSSVLSAPGTILPISRHLYAAMIVASLLLAMVLGARRPHADLRSEVPPTRHFAVGLAVFSVAAALGTGFLVFQNRGLPDVWSYYPIKFAWIAMEVLILLLFLGALLVITALRGRRRFTVAATASVSLILVSLMQLNPPPAGGVTAFFPILSLAKNAPVNDATLPLLSSVSGEKVFFYRFSTGPQDTFMNQWQFQITAEDEFTPIRSFAYNAVYTPTDACNAARAWEGGVTVVTSGVFTAEVLNDRCGDLLTAVVQEPLE